MKRNYPRRLKRFSFLFYRSKHKKLRFSLQFPLLRIQNLQGREPATRFRRQKYLRRKFLSIDRRPRLSFSEKVQRPPPSTTRSRESILRKTIPYRNRSAFPSPQRVFCFRQPQKRQRRLPSPCLRFSLSYDRDKEVFRNRRDTARYFF